MKKTYPTLKKQPNGVTCGPQPVFKVSMPSMVIILEDTISQTEYLESGGILAVLLGCHALKRHIKKDCYSAASMQPIFIKVRGIIPMKKMKCSMTNLQEKLADILLLFMIAIKNKIF